MEENNPESQESKLPELQNVEGNRRTKSLKIVLFIAIPIIIILIIASFFIFFNQDNSIENSEDDDEAGTVDKSQVLIEPTQSQNGIGKYEWVKFLISSDSPPTAISFDIKFNSEEGAKGLLTGYYDNEELGFVDEKIWVNIQDFGSESSFNLPSPIYSGQPVEDYSPIQHTLSFRLDDFSDVKSRATISNLKIALLNIEEYNQQIENNELNFEALYDFIDFNNVIITSNSNRPEYRNIEGVTVINLEAGPE